ncbi:MAG TPA: NAD(P)/FAD-dependent oxidoreductase [Bacillota bacterium]|nr:NAD(P)/FAD-dependent oxidoreductase [Bacillota bacterium]HOB87393.1 NAD(P)/FAD-dependent oxidoreductase [Bacillota bacterium]HOP68231.1 NAD(P)/FAD-dependent oxidoreductase [Bacillota bacterium]HPT33101.1 NAD(P)/FAD-dependent oxidoreductase [Bacillota bacterium]HPZ64352.1 NAD(P)/FAD-dependent oxidoreductase [Bacillota bacterium]
MKDQYDVIIIGAGPAGIFAALELTKKRKLSVLILEKGPSIERRRCAMQDNRGPCRRCSPCAILTGWGGAGAFSDGKLTLTPDFGGFLSEYMDKPSLEELIRYVDGVYLSFGASETLFGTDQEEIGRLQRLAAAANLSLVPARIRHLGTENCYQVLVKMCRALEGKAEIATGTSVEEIVASSGRVAGVKLSDGREIRSRCVICGPGRAGAEWFQRESVRLGLPGANNPVDIGVRVEVPAVLMEHLTRVVYEPKLVYYSRSFDDRIRTFCMNPYGIVVTEHNNGLVTVNGHSYAGKGSENTNFALLVSKTFTEPFNEPICYGKNIAGLANMLGGGVIVQRLGDLQRGRRSTAERIARGLTRPTLAEATPGDLSLVLPYRHLVGIMEMLEALDKLAPGVNSQHTLLYGVEVKFYSYRLKLSSSLETELENLFAVGDGAGVTRGLVQASASGVVAAREILKRYS